MKILLLSDGIPGHVNQARGLINLFKQQNSELEFEEKIVKFKHKWLRPLLKKVLNNKNNLATKLVCFAYGFNLKAITEKYNLILSAGGNTSYLNAVIADEFSLKNIFIGSLRNLNANLFSVNLTLEKTHQENNVVMQIAPCLTSSKSTIAASQQYFKLDNSETIWFMIIGGDGAGCHYSKADWLALVENMVLLSKQHHIKWLITTSRRTGLENEKILKSMVPDEVIAEAVWYNHSPQKVMQAYLGMASKVFCTVDSMSMISESISSGTDTTTLVPRMNNMTERYQQALTRLEFQGLIKTARYGWDA